jgi:hypothetical protein
MARALMAAAIFTVSVQDMQLDASSNRRAICKHASRSAVAPAARAAAMASARD